MINRLLLLAVVSLTLTACNISGSGSKGPFKAGSTVSASKLNSLAVPDSSTTINTQVSNDQGRYSVNQIPWRGWTEVTVEGQYFDEFNNADSSESITLNAITRKDRRFDTANVHLFSHLASARIKNRVDNGQNRFNAWRDTQTEIKQLFGLNQISRNIHRGVEQLDPAKGSGRYRRDNANLLLFTGAFLASGGNASSLQVLTEDFADDAQFNGDGISSFNAIASASNTTNFIETLSQNLSSNGASNPPNTGDLQQLPEWVNTDTGETDITLPEITLVGPSDIEVIQGVNYDDQGATASDNQDGNITQKIITVNPVETNSGPGTEYTVRYNVVDAAGNAAIEVTRTVTIIEAPDTNAPPLAQGQSITVDEDSSNNSITLVATDSDIDDTLTYSINIPPSSGSLTGTAPDVSYTPNPEFIGSDSFSFTVSDGIESSTADINITVLETTEPTIDVNITGRVSELNGVAISGVSLNIIAMNGQNTSPVSVITDVDGHFSLTLESGAEYTLDIVKAGYSTQIKTVTALENDTNQDFSLLPITTITNFDQDRNFKAIGKLGTSVTLTASSFENVNTDEIIEVSITSLDKVTLNNTNALAGNATGMLTGNENPQSLYILGATEFSFVNKTTNSEINLATGQTATISIPLLNLAKPDGTQVVAGGLLPLFSLNENTGVWEQEGDAEIIISESSSSGFAAVATVSHFSWWSMAFSSPPDIANVAFANISVAPSLSTTGTVSLKARTDADVSYQPDVTTFDVGQTVNISFPGWSGTETCFWAEILDNSNIFTTPEECVIATTVQGETFEIILGSGTIPPLGIQQQTPLKAILGQVDSSRILIPTTPETSVSYVITSGALPTGVSLTDISATTAIINGSPTVAGTFNFDVTATDSESNQVIISLIYEVTDAATAPVFIAGLNPESVSSNPSTFEGFDNAETFFNTDEAGLWLNAIGFTNFTLDLASLNIGAPATSWGISSAITAEPNFIRVEYDTGSTGVNPASVEGISISNTGTLTVDRVTTTFLQSIDPFNFPLYSHTVRIRASNVNGSSIIVLNLIYDAEAFFIKEQDGFNQ